MKNKTQARRELNASGTKTVVLKDRHYIEKAGRYYLLIRWYPDGGIGMGFTTGTKVLCQSTDFTSCWNKAKGLEVIPT